MNWLRPCGRRRRVIGLFDAESEMGAALSEHIGCREQYGRLNGIDSRSWTGYAAREEKSSATQPQVVITERNATSTRHLRESSSSSSRRVAQVVSRIRDTRPRGQHSLQPARQSFPSPSTTRVSTLRSFRTLRAFRAMLCDAVTPVSNGRGPVGRRAGSRSSGGPKRRRAFSWWKTTMTARFVPG